MPRDRSDSLAVNSDAVMFRIDEHAGRGRLFAVDAHGSRSDELVSGAPARHSRSRQIAIQSFFLCGLVLSMALDSAPTSFGSSRGLGRWSSDSSPTTWRNLIVVPYSFGRPGPLPRPTSEIRSRSSRLVSTLSQLTPRTSSMRDRGTGCWYATIASVS